jgi:hypothetical protein
MMRRVPCTDRAHALVGFTARTSLDETLDHVIRDIRSRVGNSQP